MVGRREKRDRPEEVQDASAVVLARATAATLPSRWAVVVAARPNAVRRRAVVFMAVSEAYGTIDQARE